jgi:hypothetical protein
VHYEEKVSLCGPEVKGIVGEKGKAWEIREELIRM